MIKRHAICLLAAFLSIPVIGFAEETSSQDPPAKHAFGVSLGWITGNGITYRHYLGEGYAQGTFIALIDKDRDQNMLDAAISGGYYLHRKEWGARFFPTAIKVVFGIEAQSGVEESSNYNRRKADYYYVGAGIGLDIGAVGREGFSVSLELNNVARFRNFNSPTFVQLYPYPGASLFYSF